MAIASLKYFYNECLSYTLWALFELCNQKKTNLLPLAFPNCNNFQTWTSVARNVQTQQEL